MPSAKNINRTLSAKVLLVDDSDDILRLISMRLKPMKFEVRTAQSAEEALSILSLWTPDVVVTDLQMSGLSGMELFTRIHTQNPLLPVIILTAHGTIPDAVKATQSGVTSFLTKPFDGDQLVREIQAALVTSGFTPVSNEPESTYEIAPHWRDRIITKNPAMQAVLQQLEQFANSDDLLRLKGEPGCGKDELARAVHARSHRAHKPIVQVSCASLPEDLLETEVYGKVGNGTFEDPERLGLLREADGGTILISDYVEASSSFLQKMLYAGIKKRATPVDSEQSYAFDVRPITTTSVTTQYGEHNKRFWELAAHLDVTAFSIPPLRERREDIPLLIGHCLSNIDDAKDMQFASKAMQVMLSADWPGNIRQLINVVRQCVRLCKTKVISEALVNSRLQNPAFSIQPLTNAHKDFEREYLIEVLKVTNGNVTRAANMAKRNRTEFHRLLKKHQIEAKSYRH